MIELVSATRRFGLLLWLMLDRDGASDVWGVERMATGEVVASCIAVWGFG
jgi:hypothetical protein